MDAPEALGRRRIISSQKTTFAKRWTPQEREGRNFGRSTYHDARDIRNAQLLREMLPELPPFCAEFFRGITPETTPLTRLNYARDLLIFSLPPRLQGLLRRKDHP